VIVDDVVWEHGPEHGCEIAVESYVETAEKAVDKFGDSEHADWLIFTEFYIVWVFVVCHL